MQSLKAFLGAGATDSEIQRSCCTLDEDLRGSGQAEDGRPSHAVPFANEPIMEREIAKNQGVIANPGALLHTEY